jgi:hypothetical protein
VRRLALFCAALLCLPATALAYDSTALASDSAAFLAAENLMHRDLSASAAALRSSQPLFEAKDGAGASLDLSLGKILAPGFEYRNLLAGRLPFESQAASAEASSALAASMGGALVFPGRLGLNLNLSYLPPLAIEGADRSLFRIGGSAQWRLLSERFYALGLLVGGGAAYVRGSESRSLAADFTEASVPHAFAGRLDSEWDQAVFDLGLFAHKTFFIINFYSRADLCLVLGSSSSSLGGITVDGNAVPGAAAEYSATLHDPALGLVLAGGMELILGELKLAAEAGRDWLSGSLYGSIGLRYGL